jgi:hypothetical protein
VGGFHSNFDNKNDAISFVRATLLGSFIIFSFELLS